MNRLDWLAATWLLLLFATQAPKLSAGFLQNGDFSQGATGWTIVGDVDFAGEQARLSESTTLTATVLSQQFTIEQGTSWLEIELKALITEPVSFVNFPDVLTFSLLDPSTFGSLVDVVPTSTNFYVRDLVDTVTVGEGANGVTVSGTSLPFTIRLDLTSLTATQSIDALLQFELVGGGDAFDASYTIDNILLSPSSPSVVPEPGSMAIWGGLVLAGFSARCTRRRHKVA
jgi:hypothetical protein